MAKKSGPWKPADATRKINKMAREDSLDLAWTDHAKERLEERDLLIGDVLHLLKTGMVYQEAEKSTRQSCYKYIIEGQTPNSEGRSIKAVVVAQENMQILKIVTVMWADRS